MGTLQKKLNRVLRAAYPDVVVDGLDSAKSTGRVLGWIASDHFRRLDDRERQDKLWKMLESKLSPKEIANLGPIVALTLTEAEARAEFAQFD